MEGLVSVIVPVYKVEQYLDKCLDSIVNQTYEKLEIILVDDGSPDSCPQRCDEWAEKDRRIQVIHKKNAGIALARNSGLDAATGDYITFVDSDDYISLDAIEIMIKRIEMDNTDMVVAQKVKVYPNGIEESTTFFSQEVEIISKEEAFHRLGSADKPFPSPTWAKLYRKYIFEEIRFPNLKTAEDTYAVVDIIARCDRISILSDTVYFYFQRDASIVHTMTREKELDNMKAATHLARFLLDCNYIKEASHYYYAAVCCSIKMKNDKNAKQLLQESFDKEERKLLRRGRDKREIVTMLATKFPCAYRFYKLYIKRS